MDRPTGEFELIEWIRNRTDQHPQVPIGIGDDTALISFPGRGESLVTVDMLLEGVHFTFETATPYQMGWKSLAVNLSDIAAMGGKAIAAVVSIALPRGRAWEVAEGVQQGIDDLARRFNVCIAGGDTNTWSGPFAISVTALGEPLGAGPIRRSGARPGDWILVTGDLGGSITGKHLTFTPRLHEAACLQDITTINAMIDISDGLAADLHHILDESHVGARLRASSIPISAAANAAHDGLSPLNHALADGEDFELLLTLPPVAAQRLLAAVPFNTPLTHIGEIVEAAGCVLVGDDGRETELPPRGWRHPF